MRSKVLPHPEGRLQVERERGDDPEPTECDDRAVEDVGMALARKSDDLAVGRDDLHRRDRGGQAPVAVARAVRPGRASARDRDVRERGRVVEGEPRRVELGAELPYLMPPSTVTVRAARSSRKRRGMRRNETRSPVVSATSLNECREPSTCSDRALLTISWSCSIDSGSWRVVATKA